MSRHQGIPAWPTGGEDQGRRCSVLWAEPLRLAIVPSWDFSLVHELDAAAFQRCGRRV